MTPDSFADSFVVLAIVPALVWLLATLGCRLVTSAPAQRCIWQMALVVLVLLMACEMLGFGRAVSLVMHPNMPFTPSTGLPPAVEDLHAVANELPSRQQASEPLNELAELPSTDYSVLSTQSSASKFDAVSTTTGLVAAMLRFTVAIWLVGTVLFLTRLLIGQALLARFAWRHQGAADASRTATGSRVALLARRLGLRRRVRIVRACTNSPVAFGLWRPTIGLPPQFEDEFSRGEQDAMLAHELAHLANCDPVWRLASDLASAALWWHPFVWLLNGRLRAACEAAADEACLVVEDGPELLAGCLLALAKRVAPAASPGWLAVEGNGFRSGLGRRVLRLMSLTAAPQRPAMTSFTLTRLVGSAALVTAVLVSTAWARPQAALTGETSMKNILTHSWRHSLAGGLLAAALASGSPALADEPKKEGDRPPEALREEGRSEARRDGERREGDRREGDRDRPAAREGERRDADPPATRREADRALERREGDRPDAARPRDFDRGGRDLPIQTRREGDRPEGVRPPREGEGVASRMTEERRRIEDQLAKMRQEHAELARAGRRDAAEGLERRMQELGRRLEELRRMATDRPGFGEGRRPDLAPEGRRPEFGRGDRRPDDAGERRPDFPPGGPPRDELISVIRDLRAEVQNLRREVNELRERVQQLSPRGEGQRR